MNREHRTRRASFRGVRRVFLWLLLALPAVAQDRHKIEIPPDVDPYTEGDADAIAAAGYVALGDFQWQRSHDTKKIRHALGGIPILFAETEHFKIGSTLGSYRRWNDSQEKKRLREELDRLRERLPGLKRSVRELDPWLRLHLTAQRLEELYDDFVTTTGKEPMDSKFLVLLCERAGDLNFYAQSFMGQPVSGPTRYRFVDSGMLFYGCAMEFMPASSIDAVLHCNMLNSVAANLIESLGEYRAPLWFEEGGSAWFSRRVDPRWNFYSRDAQQRGRASDYWQWQPKVRARVSKDIAPTAVEVFGWVDRDAITPRQLMMAWSRFDYLMEISSPEGASPGAVTRYLELLAQDLADDNTGVEPGIPLERQLEVLQEVLGQDAEEFDRAWSKYVKRNYER